MHQGLDVKNLCVALENGTPVVEDVSLSVASGELLAIVGESGSGKTTAALAMLGYTKPGLKIAGGEVLVDGHVISSVERAARAARGRLISYVPQEPANSLNPSLRIGGALRDMLEAHDRSASPNSTVIAALEAVLLPSTQEFARRYPHQLSGGQQQRVAIAMALLCKPPVVVLDEPTTGLDVVTQAGVLDEVNRLRHERGIAMIYVSHDLAVVAQVADRIAVMYAGRVVESGPASAILKTPRHPYTRGLMMAIPDHGRPRYVRGIPGIAVGVGERGTGCAFAARCEQAIDQCLVEPPVTVTVEEGHTCACLRWQLTPRVEVEPFDPSEEVATPNETPLLAVRELVAEYRSSGMSRIVAQGVSFSIARGEHIALVGESGSGKTTIARCIVGLHSPSGGRLELDGHPLEALARSRSREDRRRIQLVFQNPYDSLNPRHRVDDALAWAARRLRGLSRAAAHAEVARLLDIVRLPARVGTRFPGELSGGERQRVAIARALAAAPDLLVCDEVTSSLDVSVQAAVLELLAALRDELGLAVLFISHNLGVVGVVAERVLVLENGVICEEGAVGQVLRKPGHAYTQRLVDCAPRLPELNETVELAARESSRDDR
jgi:peptide/nickel transport system ATP-binding protein